MLLRLPVSATARAGGRAMPIDYSGNAAILDAFERVLKKLMIERTHPEALIVAEHIIALAKAGERDPMRLRDLTIQALRKKRLRAATPSRALRFLATGFLANPFL
jgi:hypothetical protein